MTYSTTPNSAPLFYLASLSKFLFLYWLLCIFWILFSILRCSDRSSFLSSSISSSFSFHFSFWFSRNIWSCLLGLHSTYPIFSDMIPETRWRVVCTIQTRVHFEFDHVREVMIYSILEIVRSVFQSLDDDEHIWQGYFPITSNVRVKILKKKIASDTNWWRWFNNVDVFFRAHRLRWYR